MRVVLSSLGTTLVVDLLLWLRRGLHDRVDVCVYVREGEDMLPNNAKRVGDTNEEETRGA